MSSTNKTPNYGLPQYIDTDKPTFLGDFNDAMGIIDKGMNDNKNSAGEGSNKMDEANARIGDAEETLTETQNQVDSISGLADTIETKVQTALTQANDAATKSGQANTNSTAAVNAANQASTDANAALQQAQGNVSQINGLNARVSALESSIAKAGDYLLAVSTSANGTGNTGAAIGNYAFPETITVDNEEYTFLTSGGYSSAAFGNANCIVNITDKGFTSTANNATFMLASVVGFYAKTSKISNYVVDSMTISTTTKPIPKKDGYKLLFFAGTGSVSGNGSKFISGNTGLYNIAGSFSNAQLVYGK